MERMENETFEAYKARRAASNKARDQINAKTKRGGTQSTRQQLRQDQKGGGTYGKDIMAAFARQRIADGTLQEKHAKYVLAQIVKKHGTGRNVEERKAA